MTATALAIFSGIFWTISYLLIVQRSIQERSVGMPLVALCINISWEYTPLLSDSENFGHF